MQTRRDALSEAARGPRYRTLVSCGAGLLLVGLACQGGTSGSRKAQDGARETQGASLTGASCPPLPDGRCPDFIPGSPRTCRVEVAGGPTDWKLTPERTCAQPNDLLEFLRPDGDVLPCITFDTELNRVFVAPDGGTFVPPGYGATKWEAEIQPDAGPGTYRFRVSVPAGGGADGGAGGRCGSNQEGGLAGESGDLEVVRDPKQSGGD